MGHEAGGLRDRLGVGDGMTITSIANVLRADRVTKAGYLPAVQIAVWMDDASVSVESLPVCDLCAELQAFALDRGSAVPPMIRATHWVLEYDVEDQPMWSRACDMHADWIRTDMSVERILADSDPLAQTTTCGDCWTEQGLAHLAGVRVPGRRTAELRLQITHRSGEVSEVDVCLMHALDRCSNGGVFLGDLLEAGVMG